jgi:hypothetical protein
MSGYLPEDHDYAKKKKKIHFSPDSEPCVPGHTLTSSALTGPVATTRRAGADELNVRADARGTERARDLRSIWEEVVRMRGGSAAGESGEALWGRRTRLGDQSKRPSTNGRLVIPRPNLPNSADCRSTHDSGPAIAASQVQRYHKIL